jgi:hypothetical protein
VPKIDSRINLLVKTACAEIVAAFDEELGSRSPKARRLTAQLRDSIGSRTTRPNLIALLDCIAGQYDYGNQDMGFGL